MSLNVFISQYMYIQFAYTNNTHINRKGPEWKNTCHEIVSNHVGCKLKKLKNKE